MAHKVNKLRLIKVGAKAHPRDRGYKYLPWLNLSGVWLVQAGFAIGDQLEITVNDGYLTIKKLPVHGDQRG
ncbi:MAG: SymE family type I addiction module toxin [Agriterribacter sp.]